MQTIQRYEIPNQSGTFSVPLPEVCAVLGLHGTYFVVLGRHDPERASPKKFVAVFPHDEADHVARHHYLGSVTREASGGGHRLQHVFEWLPELELPNR